VVLVLRVTTTVPLTFYYSICVVWREEVSAHRPVIILLRGVKWKSLFYSAVKGMIHSGGDHDHLQLIFPPRISCCLMYLFPTNICAEIHYLVFVK